MYNKPTQQKFDSYYDRPLYESPYHQENKFPPYDHEPSYSKGAPFKNKFENQLYNRDPYGKYYDKPREQDNPKSNYILSYDRSQYDRPQYDKPQYNHPQYDRPQYDRQQQYDRPYPQNEYNGLNSSEQKQLYPGYRFDNPQQLEPRRHERNNPTYQFNEPPPRLQIHPADPVLIKPEPIIIQTPPIKYTPSMEVRDTELKSKLQNSVYFDDLRKNKEVDDSEYLQIFDINHPSNRPFNPVQIYIQPGLLEHDLEEFLRNLLRFTPHKEELAFCRYLIGQIVIQQQLQPLQQELSKDYRFNSRMLFDYFDERKQSYLDFGEFKFGLNKLDISFRNEQCYALFSRFAAEDTKISEFEFHEILAGLTNQQEQLFMQRGAHYTRQTNKPQQYLTIQQRTLINQILQLQMEQERDLETVRKEIGSEEIIEALFRQIDKGLKGYLVIEDFLQYFKELGGYFFNLDDITKIFKSITNQMGGRINISEFFKVFLKSSHDNLIKKYELDGNENIRKHDYIEESKISTKEKSKEIIMQPPILTEKPKIQPVEKQDLIFPGFTKYELQAPNSIHQK